MPEDLRGYKPARGDFLDFGHVRSNGPWHVSVEPQNLLNLARLKPLRHDAASGIIDEASWAKLEDLWEARNPGRARRYVFQYVDNLEWFRIMLERSVLKASEINLRYHLRYRFGSRRRRFGGPRRAQRGRPPVGPTGY